MWLMKCNGNRGRFVIGWIKCMSRQCKVSLIVSVSLIGWTEEVDRFFQREAASVENIIKKGSDLMTCRITTTGNLINSTAFVNMYPFICPIHFFQKGLETPVSFQISAAVFWASLWLAVVFWVSLWFAVVFWASLWLAAVFWALFVRGHFPNSMAAQQRPDGPDWYSLPKCKREFHLTMPM